MTSLGQTGPNRESGGWQPSVKISGQAYHLIGSLEPGDTPPKCLQIYFLDSQLEQVEARYFNNLRREVLTELTAFFHEENNYVKNIKAARNTILHHENSGSSEERRVVIWADKRLTGEHVRRYNAQQSSEIAVLMENEEAGHLDIVIEMRNDGSLKKINYLHRAYDPMQYPIIFPHGTDGYNLFISSGTIAKVTQVQYYCFHMQVRSAFNHLLFCARLFQQWCCEMFSKVEKEWLDFFRRNQATLLVDDWGNLQDAITGNENPSNIGRRVYLPFHTSEVHARGGDQFLQHFA